MIVRNRSTGGRVRKTVLAAVLFLLSVSAGAGLVTGTTSWASGVTLGDETTMMANNAASYPLAFDAGIQNAVMGLQAAGKTSQATAFYASYVAATKQYGTALLSAADLYARTVGTDPAGAKNAFIDNFGHARAAYFGELESARNVIISEITGDAARNMFVNEFNAARDTYNNQLELIKNVIASLN